MTAIQASRLMFDGASSELTSDQRRRLMQRTPDRVADTEASVREILDRVRGEGDRALFDLARRLDGVELSALEVPRSRWREAAAGLDADTRRALERATANIRRFHEAQRPETVAIESEPGVRLERRFMPLARAGVYAPGGQAAYASSVLMGVAPALAAGVSEVVVCSPPSGGATPAESVMAACWIAGATRLFALGGAGAIGAMAYGTETVPRVDSLVGPGNRWVNEAKKQVAGDVRIDSPAGPSELLVVADGTADPDVVVAELIAQAEHDVDACVALVTPDAGLIRAVRDRLGPAVATAPRGPVVAEALARQGALIQTEDMREALDFANDYAAEHLLLICEDAPDQLAGLRTAGTIFVGRHSSVSFGDYITGANHVLPTEGRARAFEGLSVQHFLRAFTVQTVDADAAARLSADTARLAETEGLPGHARAARLQGGGAT
jgi:histidinol dehydrogenase